MVTVTLTTPLSTTTITVPHVNLNNNLVLKASDSGSVLFSASPPPVRKHEPVSELNVVNGHGVVVKRNGSPRPETPPPAVGTVAVAVATTVQPIQSSQTTHTSTTTSSPAIHFTPLPNGVPKVERLSPPPQSVCVSSPRVVVGPPPPSIYSRPNIYPSSYPPPHSGPPVATCLPPHVTSVASIAASATTSSPAPAPSYHHPPLYAPYNTTPYLPPVPTTHQPLPPPPHQTHPSHSSSHPPAPHQTHQPHQPHQAHQSHQSHQPHQSHQSHPPPHPPPHQLFIPKTEQKVLNQRFHSELNYMEMNCKPQERKNTPQEIVQPMNRSPIGLKPISSMVGPPVVTTAPITSHRDIVSGAVAAPPLVGRSHSPRGHSPTRERDSYSSNVSSLSRGSVSTPVSLPSPYTAPPSHHPPPQPPPPTAQQSSSLSYNKPSVWVSSATSSQVSPATGRHPSSLTHPQPHPYPPAPMFPPAAPVAAAPPPVSTAPPPPPPPNHPFSAESLFQSSKSNQGDLLRRELDSRFLASQDRGPYIRTEMHHHQHQHTHVHQHTTPIIPPPPPTLFTPPIFKELPKGAAVDSPFYRQTLGFTGYPGYSPGLLHPTFGPTATPFAPPTHLPTFTPKQLTEPSKPKTMKTGKWNAMHVRVAWEIYHHQQKGGLSGESKVGTLVGKGDLLRPPTHMFGPPHAYPPTHRAPPAFDPAPPPTFPPIGGSMFGRYGPAASFSSLPGFAAHAPPLHDPWSRLQTRGVTSQGFPGPPGPWGLKPDPNEEREREKERERSRERERAKREEKQRRLAASAAAAAAAAAANKVVVRERSPLREPPREPQMPASSKDDEMSLLARQPQHFLRQAPRPLPPHFPPNPWEHTYRYDPLRYNPIVAAIREEEEQRAKLFGGYPGGVPPGVPTHLRPKAPSPPTHRLPPAPHQPKEESSQSR